jgi:hypothetical protein
MTSHTLTEGHPFFLELLVLLRGGVRVVADAV